MCLLSKNRFRKPIEDAILWDSLIVEGIGDFVDK